MPRAAKVVTETKDEVQVKTPEVEKPTVVEVTTNEAIAAAAAAPEAAPVVEVFAPAPMPASAAEVVGSAPAAGVNTHKRAVPVEPLRPRTATQSRFAAANRGYRNGNGNGNGHAYRDGNGSRHNNQMNNRMDDQDFDMNIKTDDSTPIIQGYLDLSRDGHGVVRLDMSINGENDAYISMSQIRRFKLRHGDLVEGPGRQPKENERYWGMLRVDKVNGQPVEEALKTNRIKFQSLTPVYPDSQIKLETGEEPLSLRIIDLVAPIGKGQRSLVVSPPKAGKTTLLKDVASGIASNYPDIHLIAVLVGERPEEVTDIRRHIQKITNGKGEVAASNFDEQPDEQCRVALLALERAKRLVETGKDVAILLDSITRLARAYNLSIPTSGRTLSGGFDPAAIHPTKQFFGAARNFEVGGSLTIIGTALVDTGSRMDDVIFEEFKGTGNQEIILDRRLAERRVFPSIDVQRSGTRRDDLLIDTMTYQAIMTLQRMLDTLDKEERTIVFIDQLKRTKSNKEFLASLKAA
jgi:transcription termination factor Rho